MVTSKAGFFCRLRVACHQCHFRPQMAALMAGLSRCLYRRNCRLGGRPMSGRAARSRGVGNTYGGVILRNTYGNLQGNTTFAKLTRRLKTC
jgi:hypothetical protein